MKNFAASSRPHTDEGWGAVETPLARAAQMSSPRESALTGSLDIDALLLARVRGFGRVEAKRRRREGNHLTLWE
ncbi:MAG: hypothetical protein ACRDJT_09755 [Actinomycetota bacterium]